MSSTINQMQGKAEDRMADLRDKVQAASEKVGPALSDAKRHAEQAADRIGDAAGNVAASARSGLDNASEMVKEYPITAVLIAAATGYLFARLFRS
jgi:ElaB/YqjD/DUF883 family membrane-anchored ribosome-binding protein